MRITFLKNYRLYRIGDSVVVSPEKAAEMVAQGIARADGQPAPIETATAPKPQAVRKAVQPTTEPQG